MNKVNEYRFYDLGVKLERLRGLMKPETPFDINSWLVVRHVIIFG